MVVIRARSLLLRPLEASDSANLTEAVRESVESAGPWLPWCHAGYGEQDARDWISNCQSNARARRSFEFGVFTKNGRHLIGGAGLSFIDWANRCANLGYWVRQSLQGRGVATACVATLSEFGFLKLGLSRIEIVVAIGNEASAAVARKSGALLECVARNRLLLNGTPVAAQVYSLIPKHHENCDSARTRVHAGSRKAPHSRELLQADAAISDSRSASRQGNHCT